MRRGDGLYIVLSDERLAAIRVGEIFLVREVRHESCSVAKRARDRSRDIVLVRPRVGRRTGAQVRDA